MAKITLQDRTRASFLFLKPAFVDRKQPVRLEIPILLPLGDLLGVSYNTTYNGPTDIYTGVMEIDQLNFEIIIHGMANDTFGSTPIPFSRLFSHMKLTLYKVDDQPFKEDESEVPPINSVNDLLTSASTIVQLSPSE